MRILSISTLLLVAGIVAGVTSAWHALDGSALQAVKNGNGWQEWRLGTKDAMLPYTLGHFLSDGQVPPSSSARYFVRSVDDQGNTLRGDCEFEVDGPASTSRWWTLSTGHDSGSALSAGKAVLDSKRRLKVVVSRFPVPGNWILPGTTGNYTLTYIVNEPAKAVALDLPHVKKIGCGA